MVETGEGGELATERVLMLHGSGLGELFQREIVTRAMTVLDEPDPAGSPLTEDSFHPVAVTQRVAWRHGGILRQQARFQTAISLKVYRKRDRT